MWATIRLAVARNRAILQQQLGLPAEPHWLSQVHGCRVAEAETAAPGIEADALCARQPGPGLRGADRRLSAPADLRPFRRPGSARCMPAGGAWPPGSSRRPCAGWSAPASELLVWLGPAIGPRAFEVGEEVYSTFVGQAAEAQTAFSAGEPGHWLADIYTLARQRLARLGVGYVGGGEYCTVSDPARFFSYRRDGVTGRMASLIWLER